MNYVFESFTQWDLLRYLHLALPTVCDQRASQNVFGARQQTINWANIDVSPDGEFSSKISIPKS